MKALFAAAASLALLAALASSGPAHADGYLEGQGQADRRRDRLGR